MKNPIESPLPFGCDGLSDCWRCKLLILRISQNGFGLPPFLRSANRDAWRNRTGLFASETFSFKAFVLFPLVSPSFYGFGDQRKVAPSFTGYGFYRRIAEFWPTQGFCPLGTASRGISSKTCTFLAGMGGMWRRTGAPRAGRGTLARQAGAPRGVIWNLRNQRCGA